MTGIPTEESHQRFFDSEQDAMKFAQDHLNKTLGLPDKLEWQ